jgi:hypothetical protein
MRCWPGSGWKWGLLRSHLWEEDDVANAILGEEEHAQPIDPDANASRWRHAVFQGGQELGVDALDFLAGLIFQLGALLDGVVLFAVSGRNLLAVDTAFEDFNCLWVLQRDLRQRHQLTRKIRHEGGLDQGGFDQLLEDGAGQFNLGRLFGGMNLE